MKKNPRPIYYNDPFVMNNWRQNVSGKYIGKYMILVHESVMKHILLEFL